MLAHDLEAIALGYDVFDLGHRMTRQDREQQGVCSYSDSVSETAAVQPASPHSQMKSIIEAGAFADFPDTFVDLAEESFVAGKPILAPLASLLGRQPTFSLVTMK